MVLVLLKDKPFGLLFLQIQRTLMVDYPLHWEVENRIPQVFFCAMHLLHTFHRFEEPLHEIHQLPKGNPLGNNPINN